MRLLWCVAVLYLLDRIRRAVEVEAEDTVAVAGFTPLPTEDEWDEWEVRRT